MSVAPELESWYEEQEALHNPPTALDVLFSGLMREGLVTPQAAVVYITDRVETVAKHLPDDTIFFTSQQRLKNEIREQHEVHVRPASNINTLGSNPSIKGMYDLLVRVGGAGAVSPDNLKCVGEGGMIVTDISGQNLLDWMEEHQEVALDRVLVAGKKEQLLRGEKALKTHAVHVADDRLVYSVFTKLSE